MLLSTESESGLEEFIWSSFQPNTSEQNTEEDLYAWCAGGSWTFHYKLETEDITENDHELTTKTFAFVDTIDDLESERKQTGYWD